MSRDLNNPEVKKDQPAEDLEKIVKRKKLNIKIDDNGLIIKRANVR